MKKIKIFNHIWHLGHQYSLAKIPDTELYWMITPRRTFSPMPRGPLENYDNFKEYVPYYEKGKYDVAILHLDQQCLEEQLWERGKGSLFRELNEEIKDIPKIVIMHGTPYYPEMFGSDITEKNYSKLGFDEHSIGMSSYLINKFKEVVKDCDKIIFNSHTAQRQWGCLNEERASTIIHGLEPEDWRDLPKEPRVVTMISPGGLDKYYDRKFLGTVKEKLLDKGITHCHITVDVRFGNWDEYRNFLGSSLVYFNPTKESPMPRSRTEAMLSGCCVVSTFNQDSETFLEDGVNAFKAIRNPEYVTTLIEGLVNNYDRAIEIGQRGKETALKLFNHDRYMKEWSDLLKNLVK